MAKPNARKATEIDHAIGALLRQRRLEIGMSQQDLAAAIGITFQQVQKYESGANRVAASTLMRIAHCLGTEITKLLPEVDLSKRRGAGARKRD